MMRKQFGFSLVELMVAMTLGLVLMAGVIQVLISSQGSYNDLSNQVRMQETAKIALDYIVRDLRNVGYWECNGQDVNVANAVVDGGKYGPQFHLRGWEASELATASTAGDLYIGEYAGTTSQSIDPDNVIANTDVILLTLPSVDSGMKISEDTGAAYHLNKEPGTAKGTIWMIVNRDCSNMAIFSQSDQINANGNGPQVVVGNSGTGATSPNCTTKHHGNYVCNGTAEPSGALERDYEPGSSIFTLSRIAYTIEESVAGSELNSLRRYDATYASDQQKLIDGVSDLQFTYGIDTNSDGTVDRFANAEAIRDSDTANIGVCDAGELCFENVISVAIDLTVQNPSDSTQTQIFSTSVRLRNRGI